MSKLFFVLILSLLIAGCTNLSSYINDEPIDFFGRNVKLASNESVSNDSVIPEKAITGNLIVTPEPEVSFPEPDLPYNLVIIRGARFIPSSLTLNAGDRVLWLNEDNRTYNIHLTKTSLSFVAYKNVRASSIIMNNPGKFNFYLREHPSVYMVVTVK